MDKMLLEMAVRTGDSGGMTTYVVIGIVCVAAIVAVTLLGVLSKKDKDNHGD